jgi:hypothetical protein
VVPKVNVYLPDDLADEVRRHRVPVSTICQEALRRAVERLRTNDEMKQIMVTVGKPEIVIGFTGRWLVPPDPQLTTSADDARDPDVYWGVAVTRRGRIAVYATHRQGLWPPRLDDYDTLDVAAADDLPSDILARAATALVGDPVVWRDI